MLIGFVFFVSLVITYVKIPGVYFIDFSIDEHAMTIVCNDDALILLIDVDRNFGCVSIPRIGYDFSQNCRNITIEIDS